MGTYYYRGYGLTIESLHNSVTGRNEELDIFLAFSSIPELKKKFVQVVNNTAIEKDTEENRFWIVFQTDKGVAAKDYSGTTLPFNVNSPPKVLLVHGEVFMYLSTWLRSFNYYKIDYLEINLPSVVKDQFIRDGVL